MKNCFLIILIFCGALLTACHKDTAPEPDPDQPGGAVEPVQPVNPPTPVKSGYLFFNDIMAEKVAIPENEAFPIAGSSSSASASAVRSGVKSTYEEPVGEFKVNTYRFKLVDHVNALMIDLNGTKIPVQATHVKAEAQGEDKGFVFVSYNHKGEPNIGGLAIYEYTVTHDILEKATVYVNPVPHASIRLPHSQINAIDFDGSKLYLAGATDDLGFFGETKREDQAFLVVLELNPDRTFNENEEPLVKQLTSFQATSIRKHKDRIYITTGDGRKGSRGGLYVYNANSYEFIISIVEEDRETSTIKHVRSVDVDDQYIYLYQANPARVTRYDHNGGGKTVLYNVAGEAMQKEAKSEMIVWNNYLLLAQNETGLRMLHKDGRLNQALSAPNFGRPGWNSEEDVTNSMSVNSDAKINSDGENVTSDLLLVANGRQGISWYDIAKPLNDPNGKDWIIGRGSNSILQEQGSANYVTSIGNVVFVANGMGGLKVLYIGFNAGIEKPPVSNVSCTDFMDYLYFGGNNISPLLPENLSVFRNDADPIIQQLFQKPTLETAAKLSLDYIEIKQETELYVTYLAEGAGHNNSLGYFVIPATVPKNDRAEYNYWNSQIKPKMYTSIGGFNVLNSEFDGGGIIFNHIRDSRSGGHLEFGNTYRIGNAKFKPGERVVLFLCPDGWKPHNNRVEVAFDVGVYDQIFFMHKFFNRETKIPYSNNFAKGSDSFAGVQMASFFSADCRSVVLCIEDWHIGDTDVDFNDVIISITDNFTNDEVSKFTLPFWAVGKKIDGDLEIVLTEDVVE